MKVENKTRYDTRALRRVITLVYKDMPKPLPAWQWDMLVVTVTHTSRPRNVKAPDSPTSMNGFAYRNGTTSTLRIPRGRLSVPHLGSLWLHELWHLYGRKHREYPRGERHYWMRPLTWLVENQGLPEFFEEAAPPPKTRKTTEERREERVASLARRRQAWIAKYRRAATALRKIDEALARLAKLEIEGATDAMAQDWEPRKKRHRNARHPIDKRS